MPALKASSAKRSKRPVEHAVTKDATIEDATGIISSPPRKSAAKEKTWPTPARHTKAKTKCICGNIDCDAQMAKLKKVDPSRHAYFDVPSKPKASLKKKYTSRAELLARKRKIQRRQRILRQLGQEATERADDPTYSDATHKKFASLHISDEVYALCKELSNGRRKLPDSITSRLAASLSNRGLAFTEADMIVESDGLYIPLPNYPVEHFKFHVEELARQAELASPRLLFTPATTRGGKAMNSIDSQFIAQQEHLDMMRRQLEEKERGFAKDVERRERELSKKEKAYIEKQKSQEQAIKQKIKYVEQKARMAHELYQSNKDIGLTRRTIMSKQWHGKNTDAALHHVGFKDWKGAVMMMHALFGVLPPTAPPKKGSPISDFEGCLLAKMRIHRPHSITSLAHIWGKSVATISAHVRKWVPRWGRAGKNLSILHVCAGFLDKTCPKAYKDEGLEKVCAVPDGKDFKIFTPRKNSLFTRACRSEKVHASAVRCISWSTPMGLSFEHTNLFLARASENALVELWAPRLKKCPRGYSMLSDRGFANTARFYPNLNHQKTPKFLSGRKQFSAEEVSADRTICKLRYTCEVAFSRVTKTRGLRDVIDDDFFPLLDAMNHWGHATVNLDRPLMA